MSNPAPARRVAVLGLGGTIAMAATPDGGVVPALSAADLLAAVPGLSEVSVDLEMIDVRRLPGASLDFADLDALRQDIGLCFDDGADGVVVTQGTDTIEETAYTLDLLHRTEQPVVITGAMRNPTLAGADGPANLLAAISAAASPALRGLGCLVAFADEIHAAARVRKTHATSPATFVSPNTGPLGYLVEGQPTILVRPTARYTLPEPANALDCRVGLHTVTLGDDGAMLRGAAEHLDGLVVAGFGVGHVPERLVPILEHLAATMPVVLASRTGAGPALRNTYAFPGSEVDLQQCGLICAGLLDPYKARIMLRTLLQAGCDQPRLHAAFAAAGGYADPKSWPWPTLAAVDNPDRREEGTR